MNPKIGIITQARIGSTRLPQKILKPIGDQTILEVHLNRLLNTKHPVFIATTPEAGANKIVSIGESMKIQSFIGSVDDVLTRFYLTAKKFNLDIVVRVTSDCPLICSDLIDRGVDQFLNQKDWSNTYLSNTLNRIYPRGLDFEIFSFELLEMAYLNCLDIKLREHVTPFLYQENRSPNIKNLSLKGEIEGVDLSSWRLCVDEESDLALIEKMAGKIKLSNSTFPYLRSFLNEHEDLKSINSEVVQKKIICSN